MRDYDTKWTDAGPEPAIMRQFETQKIWYPKALSQILQAQLSLDRTVKTFKLLQYLKNFPKLFEVVGEVPRQHVRLRDEVADSFSNADFPPLPEAARAPSTATSAAPVLPGLAGSSAEPTPVSPGLVSLLTSLNLLDHSDMFGLTSCKRAESSQVLHFEGFVHSVAPSGCTSLQRQL